MKLGTRGITLLAGLALLGQVGGQSQDDPVLCKSNAYCESVFIGSGGRAVRSQACDSLGVHIVVNVRCHMDS